MAKAVILGLSSVLLVACGAAPEGPPVCKTQNAAPAISPKTTANNTMQNDVNPQSVKVDKANAATDDCTSSKSAAMSAEGGSAIGD